MVSASFTALIAATGAFAATIPSRELACVPGTKSFSQWTITDFNYHWSQTFSTPAHSIDSAQVSFNLTNPGVPNTVTSCSAYSDDYPNFFSGNKWISCQGSEFESTYFTYNSNTAELQIQQYWLCDTINSNKTGSATVVEECTVSTPTVNPNWKIGQTYSQTIATCNTPKSFTLKASA